MKPPRATTGLALAAVVVLAATAARPAIAQVEDVQGLTVVGKATVTARPTLAEIEMDVSAAAELTGDAIVKFRDAKKRVLDAFTALKLPDVTVEERGLMVDQKGAQVNPYMVDFNAQASKAKAEVQLSRKLVLKARNIQDLEEEAVLQLAGRLLDVAQDAGARVGLGADAAMMAYRYGNMPTSNLVKFVVEDYDQLVQEAAEKAAADARKQAERLASRNGVTLGNVLAVRETTIIGSVMRNNYNYYPYGDPNQDESGVERLTSSRFQEVPIRVEVTIRYAIRPSSPEPSAEAGQP